MSVIAAQIKQGKIYIAADSIIIKDSLKRTNFQKVVPINHVSTSMIVGGCGFVEELSLFIMFAKEHELVGTTQKDVINYMLAFSNYKEMYTNDRKIENSYIIAVPNHLFEVEGFFVQEIFDYTATGEGECYALAALHLGHDVREAVKVACDLCCNVSEPIVSYVL